MAEKEAKSLIVEKGNLLNFFFYHLEVLCCFWHEGKVMISEAFLLMYIL